MITMVDTGVANISSVTRAFRRISVDVTLTTRATDVERATVVVLPGVGAFRDGMARLHELRLVDAIRKAGLDEGTPVVGVCLGMQLLAEASEEHGVHEGLGLIPGRVVRLPDDHPGYRVPNIGWCDLRVARSSALLGPELDGEAAYFVHSYHLDCHDPQDVAATIDFAGRPITAAVARGRFMGAQFHPEKSQDTGLAILAGLVDRATTHAV